MILMPLNTGIKCIDEFLNNMQSLLKNILGIGIFSVITFISFTNRSELTKAVPVEESAYPIHKYDSIFYFNPHYLTSSFDFPVGKPDAENYYLASRFGNRNHLGEDWNGKGGGNTDLGDPVYVSGNGVVTLTEDICCGWGNVVRVVHKLEGHSEFDYLETVYAHLDKIYVHEGQLLLKGDQVGTIGTAHGAYTAHLHFEMRDFIDMSMGPGYSSDWEGYLDPSAFIRNNRQF